MSLNKCGLCGHSGIHAVVLQRAGVADSMPGLRPANLPASRNPRLPPELATGRRAAVRTIDGNLIGGPCDDVASQTGTTSSDRSRALEDKPSTCGFVGEPPGIRTPNLRIRSLVRRCR